MRKRMNVYLTTGKRSLFYGYPAIHSLFAENQDVEVYLYIVSEDLEEEDIRYERELAQKYGHKIIILHFDIDKAKEGIVCKDPDHWPLGTLGCYWMFHELLPSDVDRILAIESDTVTVGSLADFYFTDLQGYYAACPHPEHKPTSHKRLMERLGGDTLTFVMSLYNVAAIRKDFTVSDILQTDKYVVENFGHSQQELTFGILFKGRIKFLEGKTSCIEENRQSMRELGYDYIVECEKTTKILHFSSFFKKEKPWNPVCIMPGYAVWWRYALASPYYKKYIEEQWKNFDQSYEACENLKKNITWKNLLGVTILATMLFVAVAGISILDLSVKEVCILWCCFGFGGLFSIILRRILMWIQKVK